MSNSKRVVSEDWAAGKREQRGSNGYAGLKSSRGAPNPRPVSRTFRDR